MSDVPTFQELLGDFSEEVFVGRSEQLSLFEKALTTSRPPFLILDISGPGGVGKTTLLEQFRRVASNFEVSTALINEDQMTVPAALSRLAQQFEEAGYPFSDFKERYEKYRELRQEVEADPKAPKGIIDLALRGTTRIGVRSLHRVPIAGEVANVLLSP
jgi:DNA-binding NarL/FixJ family response regulator